VSLLAAIRQSASSLNVAQTGLQVVGNNIANANTPGYLRQELIQSPTAATRVGNLLVGYGVRATGVRQRFDAALMDRLIAAGGRTDNAQWFTQAAGELETSLGELGETDLSTQLSNFNAAWHNLSLQPESGPLRQLVVSQGQELASQLRLQFGRGTEQLQRLDRQVIELAAEVNRLTQAIADLNRRIVDAEGGRTLLSDASGLRDDRLKLLEELGRHVAIDPREQFDGSVTVLVGGDTLIANGEWREVIAQPPDASGLGQTLKIAATDAPLQSGEGKLAGIYRARNELIVPFLEGLNGWARELAGVINRVHSQGQGTHGFSDLQSIAVADRHGRLDRVGLSQEVRNGSFDLLVMDADGQLLERRTIELDLFDADAGTSLDEVAAQLDRLDGITAQIDSLGHLNLSAGSGRSFAFANDTSGVLAALELNTFFVGSDAASLQVNPMLAADPSLLAFSRGGVDQDYDNLNQLVDAVERADPWQADGISPRERYDQLFTRLTQQTSLARSASDGQQRFEEILRSEFLASSSVNIDEETLRMLAYQRTYQASAKLISTANELLETLIRL
jgi:flagellar hook-associated protein 1 FlgK